MLPKKKILDYSTYKLKNCSVFNQVLISNPFLFIGPTQIIIIPSRNYYEKIKQLFFIALV